uniref:Uncharacterized protein n=1 Tax=Eptatretus burgeri TaxID=7764 RepID=A0A8C4NNA6_EPTBU
MCNEKKKALTQFYLKTGPHTDTHPKKWTPPGLYSALQPRRIVRLSQNGWLPGHERAAGRSHFRSLGRRRACELLCEPRGGTRTHTVSFAPRRRPGAKTGDHHGAPSRPEHRGAGGRRTTRPPPKEPRTPTLRPTTSTTNTSPDTSSDTFSLVRSRQQLSPPSPEGKSHLLATHSPSLDSFGAQCARRLCHWPKWTPSPLIGPGGVVTSRGPPLTQWRSPIGRRMATSLASPDWLGCRGKVTLCA